MSGTSYLGKLLTPRSIQVTPAVKGHALKYMQQQGLDRIINDATANQRETVASRNRASALRMAMTDGYDTSSFWWAIGISVALFLAVTLVRNR